VSSGTLRHLAIPTLLAVAAVAAGCGQQQTAFNGPNDPGYGQRQTSWTDVDGYGANTRTARFCGADGKVLLVSEQKNGRTGGDLTATVLNVACTTHPLDPAVALPADPGYGRQLTAWSDVQQHDANTRTARFCASEGTILLVSEQKNGTSAGDMSAASTGDPCDPSPVHALGG
jgi:hypothetical protein